MRRVTMMLATLVIVFGFSAADLLGQAITGNLVGNVTDSSGAVIAGATVSAKNVDTGVVNTTTTGAAGFYTIPNLLPGNYSVTVESKGFKTQVATTNVVRVEENTRVDFSLSPGAATETIQVTAEPPQVQSTTSDIGTVLEGPQINNLPINGRLFQQLLFLVPGTTPGAWGDQDENPAASGSPLGGGAGNGTYAAVNGFPFEGNLFLVDGVSNVEPQNGYINLNIPFAAIGEMKVETSDPTAEFGTFGGAVVNLTTKSGTNQFHGEAFEYLRSDSLNARDHFAGSKNPYQANQFGGAVGGPIIKNKVFFFADFQELRQNSSSPASLTVPTAAMRTGDLSALTALAGGVGPITNANACAVIATANGLPGVPCTASAAVTQAGTYDTIPAADITPISSNLMSTTYVPLPNVTSACADAANCPNFLANNPLIETVPQFDARVDYAFSDKDRFFARESYLHRDYNNPSPGNIYLFGGNGSATNSNHNAVLAWDHIFSGTLSNEFRFGFNRYDTSDFVPAFGVDANNALGIPNGNLSGLPITSGIAQFTIQGINGGSALVGDQGPIPNGLGRLANIYEYTDNVTWIKGKHTFKFGGDIQWFQTSVRNPQNDPRGQFSFGGGYTGSGFADFLVGGASSVNRDLFPSTPATRVKFGGIYAQDDIRVNQQLTLNLGLRWDVYTAPVDAHNAQSNFISTGPNAGLIQIADSSNRGPNVNTFLGSWAPRIGFAYSPDDGKTAVRGAFGISYFPDNFGSDGGTLERNYPETLIENNSAFQSSCATTIAPSPLYSGCGSLILANGLPGVTTGVYSPLVVPSNATPGALISPPVGFGVFQIAKSFRQDVANSWNIGVQRQLTHDMYFSAAYVGTYGNHLYHDYQLNQCYPPSISVANPYPTCLPFYSINPNITTVDFRNSSGQSRYNAGQFQLIKRTNVGLTLIASYTWSKMLSNIVNPINPYDTSLQLVGAGWQTSNYPQNFTVSYSYDLPFGHGRQFAGDSTGLKQAAIGGWAVNGITTFRSGGALLINAPGSLLPPQTSMEVANYNCNGTSQNNPHTIGAWFNVACWSLPAVNTIGNARTGTGHLYGPRLQNWDFSITKGTYFGPEDRIGFKFEANFFNVFNHTNLSNPNTSCNSPTSPTDPTCTAAGGFGVIGSDNGLPRMIQLGFKILF
ncbi:MAG: carboxypeptidase regulatory-like domain-containing protein [Candidatus Acidiferrales bacterium]